MTIANRILGYLGALTILALSVALPALADAKPCCRRDGYTYNTSARTCRHNGGYVVSQRYCHRRGYDRGRYDGANFTITFGNVVFGYSDGYYDRNRGWHNWRNTHERDWYRHNRGDSYYDVPRDRDRDSHRRDWRDGKRPDWRGDDHHD